MNWSPPKARELSKRMRVEYFFLVDRILDLDLKNNSIRTESTVPTKSTIFEGHFPGYPLMPGVLLIEFMAQSAGWLILAMTRFERMPFMVAVKEAKFRTFVPPGQQLTASAKIAHEGSGYMITDAEITNDGKLVCSVNLTFRVLPFPTTEFSDKVRECAKLVDFPLEALADG
jgi:3-hydroxyacyl-[acyl-carrier-protein] dehydratase